jgi:hypothetical protein
MIPSMELPFRMRSSAEMIHEAIAPPWEHYANEDNDFLESVLAEGKKLAKLHDSWGGPPITLESQCPGPIAKTTMTDAEVYADGAAKWRRDFLKQERAEQQVLQSLQRKDEPPAYHMTLGECEAAADRMTLEYGGTLKRKEKKHVYGPSSGYEGPTGHINDEGPIIPIPFERSTGEIPGITDAQRAQACLALLQKPQSKPKSENPFTFTAEQRERILSPVRQDYHQAPTLPANIPPVKKDPFSLADARTMPDIFESKNLADKVEPFNILNYTNLEPGKDEHGNTHIVNFFLRDKPIVLGNDATKPLQIQSGPAKDYGNFFDLEAVHTYVRKGIHESKRDKIIPGQEDDFDVHNVFGYKQTSPTSFGLVNLPEHPHYEDKKKHHTLVPGEVIDLHESAKSSVMEFSSLKSKSSDPVYFNKSSTPNTIDFSSLKSKDLKTVKF